ncbi:UbiD family decarboxylase domain-containing protein [Kitasatospora sp. NPDC018058]|uniref:UbiD family decarboxylase domain-containing protein n=1 Tax=Kitasatospora sp. NPDC018058 TaxID=3364025 RepID=UPI0037BF15DA
MSIPGPRITAGGIADLAGRQVQPYALVQGGDPAIPFVGGIPIPDHVDEAGFVGALYGEPIEVVTCELSDLNVPARAETVIEGHLSVERSAIEERPAPPDC